MSVEQQLNQWSEIVAQAWKDEKFKKRLIAEPASVLRERGLDVPTGVQLRVVENTDRLVHLTIPAKSRNGELSDAELEGVAGGFIGKIAQAVNAFAMVVNDRLVRAAVRAKVQNDGGTRGGGGTGDIPGDDGRE